MHIPIEVVPNSMCLRDHGRIINPLQTKMTQMSTNHCSLKIYHLLTYMATNQNYIECILSD